MLSNCSSKQNYSLFLVFHYNLESVLVNNFVLPSTSAGIAFKYRKKDRKKLAGREEEILCSLIEAVVSYNHFCKRKRSSWEIVGFLSLLLFRKLS